MQQTGATTFQKIIQPILKVDKTIQEYLKNNFWKKKIYLFGIWDEINIWIYL